MSKLVELRNKLAAKQEQLAKAWTLAGEDRDFTNPDFLAHLGVKDAAAAAEKIRGLDVELTEIFDEAQPLAELESIRQRTDDIGVALSGPSAVSHADPTPDRGPRGIGNVIVGSQTFKRYAEHGESKGEVEGFTLHDLKATLFETASGWAPESVRSGRIVEAVTRPIQVLDIIPTGPTDQAAYLYLEETLRDHNAAEMVEGGTYAEDAYELIDRTATVRKIGTSIPVTDEQLEDVAGIQTYLNSRLTSGLRQRFDGQVLNGDGTPPNIEGINNHEGIQAQARGIDPVPDAIHRAMTKCRVAGRSFPQNVVMHPNDWQEIRLLRTADGIYIWGSPSEAGEARIWGLPVVQADSQTEGTALVGDFNFCMAFERRGIDVQVGFVGSQFGQGKRTIRADFRVAFAIFRGAAFCEVTGI